MKRWLGIAIGAAAVCAFLPPLLSGSNHTCPVLRQKDLERAPSAEAVPAFARKYNVDCTYCHTAWPQLNRTGYIFRRLGYRMPWEVPKSSTKEPPAGSSAGTPTTAPVSPAVSSGLKNAVAQAASADTIAAGQKVFTQMQCFTCHTNGENVINPAKPIKGNFFRSKYPQDAQIAAIIRSGVAGTAMPAYGVNRLSDSELQTLIAYIRSLTP